LTDPATARFADALALTVHDLAEPLREVQGFAELLERRAAERLTPEDEALVAHIQAGARRMHGLVAGLGAYVQAERTPLRSEVVDLTGLAALAGDSVEVGEIPPVRGDPALLDDMLARLVDNARKFGGDGVRIAVAGRREGEEVVVEVSDDGPGVPAGDAERVLRLFQRAHGSDEFAGAGVGLTIAAAIAQRHGGSLVLEPREGGGTTVRLCLTRA
jgi:signal transduction histidine kinase